MYMEYLQTFMERTGFSADARDFLLDLAEKNRDAVEELTVFYLDCLDFQRTDQLVAEIAGKRGFSPYSLWEMVLINASKQVRHLYKSEEVFYNTFEDLRYKAQECYDRYGVWGNFVAFWYPIFYKGNIVKLGRLEYETRIFNGNEPISYMGVTVRPGDPLLSVHIPASGEPFDRQTRLDSYRQAVQYFGKPLVCVCISWLLYQGYEPLFPEKTNVGDFRREFYMLSYKTKDVFEDGWRVFGSAWDGPMEELPENSSMQKAFKAYLLAGGSLGSGTGVLIFDGEKVLTRLE